MTTDPRPLRVGLLIDGWEQPRWVGWMLEQIFESGWAEPALIVVNGGASSEDGPRPGFLDRMRRRWAARSLWLYTLHNRFEQWRFHPETDAFEPVDVRPLLQDAPSIVVHPRCTRFSDFIEGDDLERIREAELDVMVRLGFRILRGGIHTAATAGVWSLHHGDNTVNRGGPAGFWEVMLEWPATGAILQILNEDLDNGLVLARTWSSTHPVSVRLNKSTYYWTAASLIPRKLRELHRDGVEAFLTHHQANQPPVPFYSNRLFKRPTNREIAGPFWRVLKRYVARKFRKDHLGQWQLRYAWRDGVSGAPWRFKKIVPPKDRFLADPHLIERDGRAYAFVEELPYATDKGVISVIAFDEHGEPGPPERVLEADYHLSYPFLFEWDDELYMIPETGAARRVEAYRCVEFPSRWEPAAVLMDGVRAVDATLFEHGGRWWMFVNMAQAPGASTWDELFLFHADHPLSTEWVPHPANPIVSDVRRARPAGAIFEAGGRWIRPSQDCSVRYGWALRFHEIIRLDPEEYEEREVGELLPEWDPDLLGTHTFSRAGRLTMIDVLARRAGVGH